MQKIFIFILACFISTASYAESLSEKQKISQLLDAIETSHAVFIRNGSEYSSKEAKEHLQMKLNKAGSRITTAKDFILNVASKSSSTGQPYYIKTDDTKVEAEKWLLLKLADIEKSKE